MMAFPLAAFALRRLWIVARAGVRARRHARAGRARGGAGSGWPRWSAAALFVARRRSAPRASSCARRTAGRRRSGSSTASRAWRSGGATATCAAPRRCRARRTACGSRWRRARRIRSRPRSWSRRSSAGTLSPRGRGRGLDLAAPLRFELGDDLRFRPSPVAGGGRATERQSPAALADAPPQTGRRSATIVAGAASQRPGERRTRRAPLHGALVHAGGPLILRARLTARARATRPLRADDATRASDATAAPPSSGYRRSAQHRRRPP